MGPSHYPQQDQSRGCFLSHPSLPIRLVPQAGTSPLMTKPGTWTVCSSPFSSLLSHKILLLPLGKKEKNNPWTLACSHSQGQIPSRPNTTLSPGHVLPRGPGQFQTPSYTHTHTHTHKLSQMLNPPTLFTDSRHKQGRVCQWQSQLTGKAKTLKER